jgi:hypothetical protein
VSLPDGYHVEELGKGSRPEDGLVFNEAEVHAAFDENEGGRTQVCCGYCGSSFRSRARSTSVDWFLQHSCKVDPARAELNHALLEPDAAAQAA